MKKLIIIALILSACSQDPQAITEDSLAGHMWICDSVRTTENGSSHTDILGQGKGLDWEFGTNGYYTIYFNPVVVKAYKQSNDTAYYWTPPATMNPDQYFIIRSLQYKKLHTWQRSSATKEIDTYHHYN